MKKGRPKRAVSPDTPLHKLPKAERERVEAALKQLGEAEDLFLWTGPRPAPLSPEYPPHELLRAYDRRREFLRSDDVLSTARMIRLDPTPHARPATREELEQFLPPPRRKKKNPTGERRGPKAAMLPKRLHDHELERYMLRNPHLGAPAIKEHFEKALGEPVSLKALYANPVFRRLRPGRRGPLPQ
jgi:hypothetical protein